MARERVYRSGVVLFSCMVVWLVLWFVWRGLGLEVPETPKIFHRSFFSESFQEENVASIIIHQYFKPFILVISLADCHRFHGFFSTHCWNPSFFFINGTLVCFWGCGGLDSQIQFPRLNPQPALRSTNIAGLEKQPHLTFEDVFPIEDWQNFQPLLC